MSRVFLLSSNTTTEPYPVYPLGMAMVASALRAKGHNVFQFDYFASGQSESILLKSVSEFKPDFVGISIRNIDNVDSLASEEDWYLESVKRLVTAIKNETSVPLVLGGPAFSIMPEEILSYTGADYGIKGEGEHAFNELIHNLENRVTSPEIINGSENPVHGDKMISPLFDKKLVSFYLEESGIVNLQTKRGCPYNCVYCTYPSLEGNRFRPRDPGAVVEDIKKVKQDFGADSFFFTDSVFNDAAGHYLEVAEKFIKEDVKISWSGFFRPQGIGPDDFKLLIRSGLYALELGTDASSNATLEGLNKKFDFADVIGINEMCVKNEIPCAHFVMFGGPGETEATVEEGLDNLNRLEKCVVFAFTGIRILPGTGMQSLAVRDGILSDNTSLLKPVYYFSPKIKPEAMNSMIAKKFHRRKDRIFPPSEARARMSSMHMFGFKGLIWDRLVTFSKKQLPTRSRKCKNGKIEK